MALTLEEYVSEVAGDNADVRDALLAAIGKDPKAGERATGLAMRERDYRQKTQQLSADKKIYEAKVNEYEANLQEADGKIATLMNQVAKGTVDTATANARLQAIKEKYTLSDDDIPTNREVELTDRVGHDVTKGRNVDMKSALADFKKELLAEIAPALSRITADAAATDIMWADIDYEHKELFGKRLTAKDKVDSVKEFNKLIQSGDLPRGTSYQQYWEQKYDVPAKREEVKMKSYETGLRKKWEDEQTAARSAAALDSVRGPERRTDSLDGGSPLFKKKFSEHDDPATQFDRQERGEKPTGDRRVAERQPDRPLLVRSGADRAAENWVQRRAAGVPLGEKQKAS